MAEGKLLQSEIPRVTARSSPKEIVATNGVASHFERTILTVFDLSWSLKWSKTNYAAFDYYLGKTEIVIYSILGVLLAVTAFATIATAGKILWIDLSHWTVAAQTLRVLNQLLIVLMLVEILHTVRISIRSHVLVTEP